MSNPQVRLKRYSKPRGAGDQTSGGLGKLLHTHGELSKVDILVRETLQNSWDAAMDDWYPAYGVRIREAGNELVRTLRDDVFTGLGTELRALEESLQTDALHVVEIFDRGTTGLNGPVSPDVAAPEGEPNNFNAFVFDIGTTKSRGHAGGTFGFGKTATFEVSGAHSVVYWTRCDRGDGVLEDRLIASALHDAFEVEGKRFTGAHWWGSPDVEEIEPLRGDAARRLGERLFDTHFGEDETGTSILVIDPTVMLPDDNGIPALAHVRNEQMGKELGRQMLSALLTSAWPKLVPYADGNAPMIVEFEVYGEPHDVERLVEERYRVFAHGLSSIRGKQLGEEACTPWDRPELIRKEVTQDIRLSPKYTEEHPKKAYFGDRDDRIAGHLFMARALRDLTVEGAQGRRLNSLCLMRSGAELVVDYDDLGLDPEDALEWYAVFKPTPECDVHFAASEPSTHDAWNDAAVAHPPSAYVVGHVKRQVRAQVRSFVKGQQRKTVEESLSARQLSRALGAFVPVAGAPDVAGDFSSRGQQATNADESTNGGARSAGTAREAPPSGRTTGRVLVLSVLSSELQEHGAWAVSFEIHGDPGRTGKVRATVRAMTSEGDIQLADNEVDVRWSLSGAETTGPSVLVTAGARGQVVVRPTIDASIKLELDVSEEAS